MSAATPLSELNAARLDTLQRLSSSLKIERDLLKLKLEKGIISQPTFDVLDPEIEAPFLTFQEAICKLQNRE